MDEETAKAIQEAMSILHTNAQEQQEPVTPPDALPPLGLVSEQEEEPTNDKQEQPRHDEPTSTATEPEPSETDTSTLPRKRWPWVGALGLAIGVISLTMIVVLVLLPLLRPTASVTIIPAVTTITTTTTIQVQERALSSLTLTQARTVPATGTGHQDAQAAHGAVTFYNAAPAVQTVEAGTLLTGADGVEIVTEQDAVIPAALMPTEGQVTVSAHALQIGPAGNMRAGDIYGACCRVNVFVANETFRGGQDARTFSMVTQGDLDTVTTALKTSLMQSVQAALQAQLHQGEALVPPSCTTTTKSDHKAGQEATQVSVTIMDTCTGDAYQTQDVAAQVTQHLTTEANTQLGDGYTMTSDPQTSIIDASTTKGNTLTLHVKGQASMAYQFSQGQLQEIKHTIAGMNKARATAWLAHLPGVRAVSIEVSGGNATTLPQETSAIHCTVLYAG